MADVTDNAALGRYELAAGSKLAVAYYREHLPRYLAEP